MDPEAERFLSSVSSGRHGPIRGVARVGLFQKRQSEEAKAAERLAEQVQVVRTVLERYAAGTRLTFGAPTRCPKCGDYGFVESVNRFDGIAFNHCFGCAADWMLSREALRIVAAEQPPEGARPAAPAAPAQPDEPAYPPPPALLAQSIPAEAHQRHHVEPPPAITERVAIAPTPAAVSDPVRRTARPAAPAPPIPDVPESPMPAEMSATVPAPSTDADEHSGPQPNNVDLTSRTDDPLRVLIVEDNPFDLGVLEELIELVETPKIELLVAATRAEGEGLARSTEHDIVLLDLSLPDSSGITTLLEWRHAHVSDAPVVILSGDNHPETIKEARALGVAHFIQKDQLCDLLEAEAAGGQRLVRLLRSTIKRASAATQAV